MLYFGDNQVFATGVVTYLYQPAIEGDTTPRISLPVQIGEQLTSAFVDTGGTYFICDPSLAETLDLVPEEVIGETTIRFRGIRLSGSLYRFPVLLQAEEGDHLTVNATVFVPQLTPNQTWEFSSIIGLTGFLERIRFAVDPSNDRFYFGSLDEK